MDINGNKYEWANIVITLNGVEIKGITTVEYSVNNIVSFDLRLKCRYYLQVPYNKQ